MPALVKYSKNAARAAQEIPVMIRTAAHLPPSNASRRAGGPGPLSLLWLVLLGILLPAASGHAAASPAGKPDFNVELAPTVTKLLDDKSLSPAERRSLAIFHGQSDRLKDLTITEQAQVALQRYDLNNSVFSQDVPVVLRAKAALLRGEPEQTLALLDKDTSAEATLLKARALEDLGRVAESLTMLTPLRETLKAGDLTDAAELTAATEGLLMLARLEGRPAQDYRLALSLLAKARGELDRMYWPAYLAEARLLDEKDNPAEASGAILDTLRLNPQASEAWYLLARMSAEYFDFDKAAACVARLRGINPQHPLADDAEVRLLLAQRDAQAAQQVIGEALKRYPRQRNLLALDAAVEALLFNDSARDTALARFDQLAPKNPLAFFTVGKYLAQARQYKTSEAMLRRAIGLAPNWPDPRVELGLLLMQSGDETAAQTELKRASDLDPFNFRVSNQLKLIDELLTWGKLETPHFLIRYKPGIDEVLARDLQEMVEQMYADVTSVFQYQPENKTLIEVLPDEKWFAVRITGLPEIWTIGASTGDVIAITPPRAGAHQRGAFDWDRVIRHEFVHTVTLAQTRNRLPHWFTEACAVSQEPGGRDYNTCRLLADALQSHQLFALDQINWAFIRPKTPRDRPLAYAQAHWMVEYLTATYGHEAIVKLLTLYGQGVPNEAALQQISGKTSAELMAAFQIWATEQVKRWGLLVRPEDAEISKTLAGKPPDPAALAPLLAKYPDNPSLLRFAAQHAIDSGDAETARQAVLRYAASRPVDSWSDQMLADLALKTGRPDEAMGSLEQLDRQTQNTGIWSYQLAKVYRARGQLGAAAAAAERALNRDPYNAAYRELAAVINLQRGDERDALRHLEAMTLLEPDQAVHFVRLAAYYAKLGRKGDAKIAAEKARKIDPQADVGAFLDTGG